MVLGILRLFLMLAFLTGIVYPLFVTLVANILMPHQAKGSFIIQNGKKIASSLIAQKFENPKYFWPRPSAVDYNPLLSGGSNLGPTSKELKEIVKKRGQALAKAHQTTEKSIPSELVFASASGIDPHISLEATYFQMERVFNARGWKTPEERKVLTDLIQSLQKKSLFGPPYINVLILNLRLDEL